MLKKMLLISIVLLLNVACSPDPQASIIAPGAQVEKVAGDFAFTEGPASYGAGIVFTDQPNDNILHWQEDEGVRVWRHPSGRSNGLFAGPDKRIYACADAAGMLLAFTETTVDTLWQGGGGERFNGPNDLYVDAQGGIYFTDPHYQRPYWRHQGPSRTIRGVYYLTPKGELLLFDSTLQQPNGIIGTPDGKILYVADIDAGKTYRYHLKAPGQYRSKELFASEGSDGMTIDHLGNVYLTNNGIKVFDSEGKKVATIRVPEQPANLCFAGNGKQDLMITARTSLYRLKMRVRAAF
jgi:gluconolactonase